MGKTLFEKIWDRHVAKELPGGEVLLYIDRHLVHEVTSPQAFEGLRIAKRKVRRPERTVATADHNVPTTDRSLPILDPVSKQQIDTLRANCSEFGVKFYDLDDVNQGVEAISDVLMAADIVEILPQRCNDKAKSYHPR